MHARRCMIARSDPFPTFTPHSAFGQALAEVAYDVGPVTDSVPETLTAAAANVITRPGTQNS